MGTDCLSISYVILNIECWKKIFDCSSVSVSGEQCAINCYITYIKINKITPSADKFIRQRIKERYYKH